LAEKDDNQRPIIVKKTKKVSGGGHHGGAWKVAYADFTTAMMAFFMLLWLLNVSDKKTLEGLADYFTPTAASISGESGAGKPLSGTVMADSGARGGSDSVMRIQGPPATAQAREDTRQASADDSEQARADLKRRLEEEAKRAVAAMAEQLRQSIREAPELARHRENILIEETPEGVRIQITDSEGRSMFRESSDNFYAYAERMVRELGGIIAGLPNRIAIIGHTDSGGFAEGAGLTNWDLSAQRANATLNVLANTGVSGDRFAEVAGKAATEPLYPTAPARAENRRIAILVLNEPPVVAPESEGG